MYKNPDCIGFGLEFGFFLPTGQYGMTRVNKQAFKVLGHS